MIFMVVEIILGIKELETHLMLKHSQKELVMLKQLDVQTIQLGI